MSKQLKQPKIKIFGGEYKVIVMEFDKKTGDLKRVVYEENESRHQTVFKGTTVLDTSLTSEIEIKEPTYHPYHDFAYAPDLVDLLVWEGIGDE